MPRPTIQDIGHQVHNCFRIRTLYTTFREQRFGDSDRLHPLTSDPANSVLLSYRCQLVLKRIGAWRSASHFLRKTCNIDQLVADVVIKQWRELIWPWPRVHDMTPHFFPFWGRAQLYLLPPLPFPPVTSLSSPLSLPISFQNLCKLIHMITNGTH